jgi:glycosyltransferase involved in cell wall biosynthesis
MQAFKQLNIHNKTLLCSTWDLANAGNRLKSKLQRNSYNLRKTYKLFNTFVSDDNVQTYMNAADVLVVPRTAQLNSGLVYLGLSFGKIIVAPDMGNITEVIEQTHNVLFNPNDVNSLKEAMLNAYSLKDSNLDFDNRVYAQEYGDWDTIAEQHIDFYRQKLNSSLVK